HQHRDHHGDTVFVIDVDHSHIGLIRTRDEPSPAIGGAPQIRIPHYAFHALTRYVHLLHSLVGMLANSGRRAVSIHELYSTTPRIWSWSGSCFRASPLESHKRVCAICWGGEMCWSYTVGDLRPPRRRGHFY